MNNAQKKNKEKADCTDKKYKYSQLKSFFKQIAKENYKNISIFKKAVYWKITFRLNNYEIGHNFYTSVCSRSIDKTTTYSK